MKVFNANISLIVADYLNDFLKDISFSGEANQKIFEVFGIQLFFADDNELNALKEIISLPLNAVAEPDRAEYGDFQTNENLANSVTLDLASKITPPEIVVEPTCGKGNFIIAVLKNLKHVKKIFGVEIFKPYIWESKFNIIDFYLGNPENSKPEILISHCDVFDFDFKQIAKANFGKNILVIGNPPWVTNAKLGSLNSSNLPKKTNFKNHSGLDAMTGKGNFDIAEFITLTMLNTFQMMDGHLLLLVKNSVIKNIVFDQKANNYLIASMEKHCIDTKKEFKVSVEASFFYCKLNSKTEFNCKEFNYYNNEAHYQIFGWFDDKFVSNIDTYIHTRAIDGESPFVWRQGLKHDCSTVMELEKLTVLSESKNVQYKNGLNEEVILEDGIVYGILKSSDLKNTVINQTRKFTIVTQKKVGQDTNYIQSEYPKTFKYLTEHRANFDVRKSSIYYNKPPFSIFGIGDYSFKPFKVAISGLYKTFHFTLVLPQNEKPVMLDDTCYFIGFDKVEFAAYALILLNSDTTKQFLQSITFADAKRTFTKDILMRINFLELAKTMDDKYLESELFRLNTIYNFNLTLRWWDDFLTTMKPVDNGQLSMAI